jgi:hypothetical protein
VGLIVVGVLCVGMIAAKITGFAAMLVTPAAAIGLAGLSHFLHRGATGADS